MRTRLQKWTLLIGIRRLFCAPADFAGASHDRAVAAMAEYLPLPRLAISAISPETPRLPPPDIADLCVGCHGEMGDGNGEVAQWLDPPMWPKPRDFQLGVFKCRSTPTGTLPTDEDLFDTIARGLDRSSMPQWSNLTKVERADLVAWIKHFSPRWQNEKPGTPITDPSRARSHRRNASRQGVKYLPGSPAGSVMASRAWPMARPPLLLPTISASPIEALQLYLRSPAEVR